MSVFIRRMLQAIFCSSVIICIVCILCVNNKCLEYEELIYELNNKIVMMEAEVESNNNKINNEIKEIKNDIADIREEIEKANEVAMVSVEPVQESVFFLDDYQRWVVECMVAGESMIEPYEGQVGVAQCILNACLKDGIQPSEVRTKYKYSGWHEEPSESVKKAVSAVFDDGYKVTDEYILYFYAPKYAKGKWHETQDFVMEIGGHRFFAEWNN